MKKIVLFVVASAFAFAVNAQDATKQAAAKPAQTTATPVATQAKDMNTKPHVCTAACKDGKHVYAHGEKGHTCTAACQASAKPMPAAKPAPAATPEKK